MIYFVDDQGSFLDNMKTIFKNDAKYFTFSNDALSQAVNEKPAVFVSDIFMPQIEEIKGGLPQGIDGLKLCQIIAGALPQTQVVIVSGNTRSEIEKRFPGMLEKFQHFFEKPLDSTFIKFIKDLNSRNGAQECTVTLTGEQIGALARYPGKDLSEKLESFLSSSLKKI